MEKIRISGYRKFRELPLNPHPRFNIPVDANEVGASALTALYLR
jgi:predicted ATPase